MIRIEELPPAAREQATRKLLEQEQRKNISESPAPVPQISKPANKTNKTAKKLAKEQSKQSEKHIKNLSFIIPLAPITKKNSRVPKMQDGKFVGLLQSEQYQQYEKDSLKLISGEYKLHIDYPVNVKAVYYVKTQGRVDKTNLESALLDILVTAGVLADDSAQNPEIVVSTDGSRVFYDKQNPRTEIEITASTNQR